MTKEWKCPCMPQCPNYGKCRQCIAAHAAYYTVPKCIKLMQQEMREKHLHPGNPHIRKSLPQRVREYYEAHPNVHLRTAAEALNITQWQLLNALEDAASIPASDFGEVYGQLQKLERVMLHVDTGAAVVQLQTPLPESVEHGDTMLLQCDSMTALVFPRELYAIFLVREKILTGKESLSLVLVGDDEKIVLSIYLPRTPDGAIESNARELFEGLWTKYYKEQE